MSGSATIGGSNGSAAPAAYSGTGPFVPYEVPTAQKLNYELQYGNKLGGSIDNCPIGLATPNTGAFTQLTAPTMPPGDNSNNAATTAFVQVALGTAGTGGSISVDSPHFTGTPTAPTPTTGDSSTALATTAFVTAATNAITAAKYSGNGLGPGFFRDDGSGQMTTINAFFFPPINVTGATSSIVLKQYIDTPVKITGIRVEAPGAGSSGSNYFQLTATRTSAGATSPVGTTLTGSVSSTNINPITGVNCSAGDFISFTVGAITGTVPVVFVQLVGTLL